MHRILMCPPRYFGVHYSINPWMQGQIGRVNGERARQQWESFSAALRQVAAIDLLEPRKEVPDMVFTANAGLVHGSRFIPSRFRYPERRREEPLFQEWFRNQGYELIPPPPGCSFEGAGDALFSPDRNLLWAGWGFRTAPEIPEFLERSLDVRVIPLKLTDPRFYHLDTCFCPLEDGGAMYYPPAFDEDSRNRILENVRTCIPVSEEDALAFACNAVLVGRNLFMNFASPELNQRLTREGYAVHLHPVDEFLKAGGANKCLTLELS